MTKRAAFVTIGQSPRPDILDEMRPSWGDRLEVVELGALDDLTRAEISKLAPADGDARLVSRLRDGTEVVLRADAVHEGVRGVLRRLETADIEWIVLLCTGPFTALESRHLVLESQRLVDHSVSALHGSTRKLGILVPDPGQRCSDRDVVASHASPYDGDRFAEAARELAPAELIVLHCMGYTGEHKKRMAELTQKPVLLAREIVATSIAWLLP